VQISGDRIIPKLKWQESRALHVKEIVPFTSSFRHRRGSGNLHPVYDFLFTYYNYSSAKLEKWHPGFGLVLECDPGEEFEDYLKSRFYVRNNTGIRLDLNAVRPKDIKQLKWVAALSKAITERSARFSCLGLHEWAMVYRAPAIRHEYPLRLSADQIGEFLESSNVNCSHFDAFRFFTPAAVSLNVIQPDADSRLQYEQGGCLHANMDLYKWAYKLSPLVSSDLLRKSFKLALQTRELDMRASPYDFLSIGFQPVKIETPEGQAQYIAAQREIAADAAIIRQELVVAAENILCLLSQELPEILTSFVEDGVSA